MSSKTRCQIVLNKESLNKRFCVVINLFFNTNFRLFSNVIDSDNLMMKIQIKDQIWTNTLKFARKRWKALYFVFFTTVTKVLHVLTKECSDSSIYIEGCLLSYSRECFLTAYPFGAASKVSQGCGKDIDKFNSYTDELIRERKIYKSFQLETIHPFHILPPSPWPFFASAGSFFLAVGAVMCMHSYFYGRIVLFFGMITTITVMFNWWRDVIREGLYEKMHNNRVQTGLALGVMLFIVSEAMLFFTFFWAFFYFSCVPTLDPEHSWPPKAIKEVSHLGMAAANTSILLATSFTITWSHNASIKGDKKFSVESLTLTIALSILFLSIQLYEFRSYSFSISDSVYGSCFYMITGFHGFHVIIGTIGLIVALIRAVNSNFTNMNHLGVTAAIWYWHFVDVVWLFVFTTVYCWGN